MQRPQIQQSTLKDIQQMFKKEAVYNLVLSQIQQIYDERTSVVVIYQKLFIKIRQKTSNSQIHVDQNDCNLYMIKINKNFPLENSLKLYLLKGCYQPRIFDTRDLVHQVLGQIWSYNNKLKDIMDNLPAFQEKMIKRNENYLALQKTGQFLLGDVFIYNELQEHTSLSLFVDKNSQNNNLLNAVSQTHFLTFQRVLKKVFKSKQEEEYELKSKTLYGKKFMLSKFCDLQCIQSMQISTALKQISLIIRKYRSIKSSNDFETTTRKIAFNDEQSMKQFMRIVLKNLPKYQPTKVSFLPAYDKSSIDSKQDSAIQRVLQLNDLQNRLQQGPSSSNKGFIDPTKKQQAVNRLNRSYQKMIQYYSARANPYYLIYVNKLNWLYQKYFYENKSKGSGSEKGSFKDGEQVKNLDPDLEQSKQKKSKLTKSLTAQY